MAIIGMQWGDEGKGKIVDLLSESAAHIARAQGGNNAGHTVVAKGVEYRFHLIPSGILYPSAKCYIGGGTVIDPASLLAEMDQLRSHNISFEHRLFISSYAHVVFPYHRLLDELADRSQGIGTTKKGIGPCYADKANRLGLRMADLLSKGFRNHLKEVLKRKNFELEKLYGHPPLDFEALASEYERYAQKLASFLAPVEEMLYKALKKEKILLEGAQGTLLDLTFGTYPFVTSSSTIAGGIPAGLGLGPAIDCTLGVVKAYTTRVGNGPLPTELSPEEMARFPDHIQSREIGVTTGRKRRFGWFDAVLAAHTLRLSGINRLALMKLDILDGLDEIRICKSYLLHGKETSSFPVLSEELLQVSPVYETLRGWKSSTKEAKSIEDLPKEARAYLSRIEELCAAPISLVSVGPGREQTLFLDPLFKEADWRC